MHTVCSTHALFYVSKRCTLSQSSPLSKHAIVVNQKLISINGKHFRVLHETIECGQLLTIHINFCYCFVPNFIIQGYSFHREDEDPTSCERACNKTGVFCCVENAAVPRDIGCHYQVVANVTALVEWIWWGTPC